MKSAATQLVEIAEELYTFGRTPSTRVHGEVVHEGETFAHPKGNPAMARPLADIRPDLAAVYLAQHEKAPPASALGDAMTVLEGKARATEPVSDDAILGALTATIRQNVATLLIEMALDAYDMGCTRAGEPFAVVKAGPRIALMLRGGKRSLRAELAKDYFAKHKSAAPGSALSDAMLTLEGIASAAEPAELALRVAQDGDMLILDLGDDTGRAVLVSPPSWAVEKSPVLFRRTKATGILPEPARGGSLDELWQLVNVEEEDQPLLSACLVAGLIPGIPHPVLRFTGEHGTAKTTTARFLARLLDPSPAQTSSAPKGIDDWCVACAASWVTCLDNLSHIEPWLSDAICKAVTGDGLRKRALYSDSDVAIVAFRRVVMMTTIGLPSLRGDLADRLVSIACGQISEKGRRSGASIAARWADAYPRILGGLCDLATQVLAVLPGTELDRMPRMADYARILAAVDQVLGTKGYDRYLEQAREINRQVIESDPVALAIVKGHHLRLGGDGRHAAGATYPSSPGQPAA